MANGFHMCVGRLGKFGVLFDSSGAEKECVSAVAVVKEEQLFVVSSHPAQRKSSRWGLVEAPAGILHKVTHTYMYIQVILPSEYFPQRER